MAENPDDERHGTIALTDRRAPPCFVNGDPEQGYGDVDGDGYVTDADAQLIAEYTIDTATLTPAQLIRADVRGTGVVDSSDMLVIQQYVAGLIDTFPVCIVPAEGELVEVDIPASVPHGASYDVTAKAHNKGGSTGTFEIRWYTDTVLRSTSGTFTLAADATSEDKVLPATAPTTGASMTYNLRLIRII